MAKVLIGEKGFRCYGQTAEFFYCKDKEVIIHGPYDTGKSYSALQKLNLLLAKYPKARGLLVRKTYKSLISSIIPTWEDKVHNGNFNTSDYPIKKVGGRYPQQYIYPNGSTLTCSGLDDPGKTLSAEYDFIFVAQAEQLTEDEWEALTRASSGRSGNTPYTQLIGDCNPDIPTHWILNRKSVKLFKSTHKENPTIYRYDNGRFTGELTASGRTRIETLQNMTGVRRKRGYEGLWVGREGMVYETFDRPKHVLSLKQLVARGILNQDGTIGKRVRYVYGAVDWGFRNPTTIQVWAVDSDDIIYLIHERYQSEQLISYWVETGKVLKEKYNIRRFICDPAYPANIQEFNNNGLSAVPADNEIRKGIDAVNDRLEKSTIYFYEDALYEVDQTLKTKNRPTSVLEEFPGYVWPEGKNNKNADENPVKTDDHGLDGVRYLVVYIDKPNIKIAGVLR